MTPSEHQRLLGESKAPKPRTGLDRIADGLLGRWRRAPWVARRLQAVAVEINRLREEIEKSSDSSLNGMLDELRLQRRRKPFDHAEFTKGIAVLAVAAHREIGLRAYEVQLMASAALVQGYFTEVDTGEGKTLAIGIAAAFKALNGLPCHVITANDYLAGRDAENLKIFYKRVGLTVGAVLGEDDDAKRREAYGCDVTYSTAKEVAADYLRDRLRGVDAEARGKRLIGLVSGRESSGRAVQRGLHAAVIDEADHALIDEAVTPLIISRPLEAGEMEPVARAAWALVKTFEPGLHYQVDRTARVVELFEPGMELACHELDLPRTGLWASDRRRVQVIRQAVEARELLIRDEHYVVDDGKVVIVDSSTGRPMPMRSWQQGLHQIIEAKEGLDVSGGSETMARISFQTYFRKYHFLAGASGTLKEVAGEIWHTYHAPFVKVPRNQLCQRQYAGIRFCATREEQQQRVLHEIKSRHGRGQPLLIGSRSVERSEQVASLLRAEKIPVTDRVLNAVHHRREATLVALAGRKHAITIATSMAGRGTDIRLEKGVEILGGLHVVSVDANQSARVDRQLFGRAARQADPGSVMSIYSADDELLVRFIPQPLMRIWTRALGMKLMGESPQWMGRLLLFWSQYRTQQLAARSRRNVMLSETEIRRSLGFAVGR